MSTHRCSLNRRLASERGAALFAAVLAMLILSTMMVAFAVVARDESLISQNAREAATAELAAEAGANYGRWMLAQRLRQDLSREVSNTDRAVMVNLLLNTYNTSSGAAQFLIDKAIPSGGGPTFQMCGGNCIDPVHSPVGEIPDGQQVILTLNGTNPTFTSEVIVGVPPGAAGVPVIKGGGTAAEFTYMWRVQSTGRTTRSTQVISHDSVIATLPTGTFKIAINSGFVQYAHFIDQMDDSQAWMSFRHVYTGPVHTNTRFNILGNPTGPTFRSEATQRFNDTRFNNSGSDITEARDSTANDWPLLGPSPGVLCKSVDCTGFTRNFDFDPTTAPIDPIPFPAGANPLDRQEQIDESRGMTPGGPPDAVHNANCTAVANKPGACPADVIVANTGAGGFGPPLTGTIVGGIYVYAGPNGVRDLQLEATPTGQRIIICTTSNAANRCQNTAGTQFRTTITENRAAVPIQTIVVRECARNATNTNCNGGGTWGPVPVGVMPADVQTQVLLGSFTPSETLDHGVLFARGSIGVVDTEFGLRQAPNAQAAIYNSAVDPKIGARWTIVADGDIFVTGHMRYQRDPRGNAPFEFSTPTPGTGDDQIDVQNTLGIVSWSGGVRLSRWLSPGNLAGRYPVLPAGVDNNNLHVHGMIMAANLNNNAVPSGQFSFDDPNGAYRGKAMLLGGVVQKTMGTLGSPGTPGTGYARDWVYDERFRHRGMSPPLFPGFPKFTAATGLGIDSYTFRAGRF